MDTLGPGDAIQNTVGLEENRVLIIEQYWICTEPPDINSTGYNLFRISTSCNTCVHLFRVLFQSRLHSFRVAGEKDGNRASAGAVLFHVGLRVDGL